MASLYDGPVIDAHHHLWRYDPASHPWLDAPGLEGLRRDVDALAYRAAAGDLDIRGTVWVEALATDPLAEAVLAQQVHAAEPGLCNAVVAGVPLDAADIEARLDALQAAVPSLRAVRDIVAARPAAASSARPADPLGSPRFEQGLRALERRGLAFDLLAEASDLGAAATLFARLPGLQVVIEHAGSPDFAQPAGAFVWREGLARMAALPHVAIKVSALHCRQPAWTDEMLGGHVRTIIDLFGADRVAFGSDFPVHDQTCATRRAFLTFARAVRALPPGTQRAVFHDTARRLYRF